MSPIPNDLTPSSLICFYGVQAGDTLASIAKLFGVAPGVLLDMNGLADTSGVKVGLKLAIPDVPTGPVAIAKAYVGKAPTSIPSRDRPIFVWPSIGPITTPFGVPGSDWIGGYHMGLDVGAPMSAPIRATCDGNVEFAGPDLQHGYGNHVILDHGGGYETLYAHMSVIHTVVGKTVRQGDLIGEVGATGYAFGPHLHFEVRLNTEKVDPAFYLP